MIFSKLGVGFHFQSECLCPHRRIDPGWVFGKSRARVALVSRIPRVVSVLFNMHLSGHLVWNLSGQSHLLENIDRKLLAHNGRGTAMPNFSLDEEFDDSCRSLAFGFFIWESDDFSLSGEIVLLTKSSTSIETPKSSGLLFLKYSPKK